MSGRSGTATCALGANSGSIKRGRRLPYCLLLVAIMFGAAILRKDAGTGFPTAQPRSHNQWAHLYAALPLSFEANRGQTDSSVNFLSRGQGFGLFLAQGEAVLTLKNPRSAGRGHEPSGLVAALRLKLVGANAHPTAIGTQELPGKANYFIGNDPRKWHTDVPTYARVRYESVYPGIDLTYYGTQKGELEYDFVVAPGADPKSIALGIDTKGHTSPHVNSDGSLVVPFPSGDLQLHKPVVYQEQAGNRQSSIVNRQSVEGRYVLDAENHVRFEVGPYDHNRPLVIDPVLIYATYLGGSGGDFGDSITVDSNGDAYIAGETSSSDFPTFSPYQEYKGTGDAFITKLNNAGTKLIFSTYLGGSTFQAATALAVSNGSTFVTGYTSSSDFPVLSPITTANPFQMTYAGGTDAFVTEISTLGNNLVYSTFLGGTGEDYGQGIAVDSTGAAYVTGFTQSTNFPLTSNALQSSLYTNQQSAFVTKMNLTGTGLTFSTYLGGSTGSTTAQAIQIDSSENMYIAGCTNASDYLTLHSPVTPAIYPTYAGGQDAFVTEIAAAYTSIPFSTFLGGSDSDCAKGIALDSTNNVYVAGTTASQNFPTTSGAFQTELKGSSNAFVTKLNTGGAALGYSTYLGGSGADQGNAIAVTPAGVAVVTGLTNSTNFPIATPIQALLGLSSSLTYCGTAPCSDAFITQFSTTGAVTFSTYLGGNGEDSGGGIAVDSSGDPYVTGLTQSTNFPAIYGGTYKATLTGTAGNAFVAKIDFVNTPNVPSLAILPSTVNFGNEAINVTSALQQIYLVNPSTTPLNIASIQVGEVGNSFTVFTETDNCVGAASGSSGTGGTLPGGGGYCIMNVGFTPNTTGTVNDQITITDNDGNVTGSTQTISLTGFGTTANTAVTVNPSSLTFTSQPVGTVSAPQTVTITNTGAETLDISSISLGTSKDYTVTNPSVLPGCLALNNTLTINQSCQVTVTFNPTASGTRSALLAFTDNAAGSPQTISLTGTGAAVFSLSAPSSSVTVNPAVIGELSTTFLLEANGPTGYTASISLACSASTVTTCAFSTNPVVVGQTTTLTISNLTTSLPNPYIFTVTGTSGSQTTSLQLNLDFEDYTLTVTPSVQTIMAGNPASYTVLINPLFGFNQQIQLSCYQGQPPSSNCIFNPSATITPSGNGPTSVGLQITTVKYIPTTTHTPPRLPPGPLPPLIFGLLSLAGVASLAWGRKRHVGRGWLALRLGTLSVILALNLALAACRSSTLIVSGTTTGNYTITIAGTMVSNTAVLRTTTMALAVTGSPVTQ